MKRQLKRGNLRCFLLPIVKLLRGRVGRLRRSLQAGLHRSRRDLDTLHYILSTSLQWTATLKPHPPVQICPAVCLLFTTFGHHSSNQRSISTASPSPSTSSSASALGALQSTGASPASKELRKASQDPAVDPYLYSYGKTPKPI